MMRQYERCLSIVLAEDVSFTEMMTKTGNAFNIEMSYKDDKGRFIARAQFQNYHIELIDKIDMISELLCDVHYTLDISVEPEKYPEQEFTQQIIDILQKNTIRWSCMKLITLDHSKRYTIKNSSYDCDACDLKCAEANSHSMSGAG
ncbi:hypothetical protein HVX92_18035 [Escherichia fergusonii]|nr:hypothetical protein HVX92_18035 [Escherichia fergusonii]QMJ75782.1 hypothetical protein HVX91_18055 [Escherichia fergusonii]